MTKSEDETPYQSANGPAEPSENVNRVKGVEEPAPPTTEYTLTGEDASAGRETSTQGLNPYRPEELWTNLDTIYAAGAVKRRVTTIPLRRPHKHEFFRTREGDEYWKAVALIEYERVLYLVHPKMIPHLDSEDFFYAFLCLCISKSGELFFWPLKISNKGRTNMWNESSLEIAKTAIRSWVKIRSRQEDGKGSGFYEADVPLAQFDDPVWPNKTLKELYDIAFKGGRIIDRPDHLVVQKLFGQIK